MAGPNANQVPAPSAGHNGIRLLDPPWTRKRASTGTDSNARSLSDVSTFWVTDPNLSPKMFRAVRATIEAAATSLIPEGESGTKTLK